MKVLIVLFLLIAAALVPVAPAQEAPPELDVRFHEVLRLGDDESKPLEYLFGEIVDVAADSRGNLYVADGMGQEIRVFSPEGEHLRTMGGRGEGPGEFQRLHTLALTNIGEVLTFDYNRRVTRFSPEGEVVATYPTDHSAALRPASVHPIGEPNEEAQFLIYCKMEANYASGPSPFLYVFDQEFSEPAESFASDELLTSERRFVSSFHLLHTGSLVIAASGEIYIAPGLYDGTIYGYEWGADTPTSRLDGYVEDDGPAFEPAEPNSDAYETNLTINRVEDGEVVRFGGLPRRTSAGLFQLSTGEMVHFTYYNHDTHAHLGAEVFAKDGELIGYGRVEENLRAAALKLSLEVAHVDDEDRLYLIDRNEEPVIRVVEFTYEVAE